MSTTAIGRRGEEAALRHLEKKGYRLLQRNYRSGSREIDLVLCDGETIVFVEVKARTSLRFGTPGEAVTSAKRRLLTLAAEAYLLENGLNEKPARFDVVEVYLSEGRVRHIENAFYAS